VVQDAFTTAVEQWPRQGTLRNPLAWIVGTGRHKAIDRTRRNSSFGALAGKLEPLAQLGADLQVVMGYNMGPNGRRSNCIRSPAGRSWRLPGRPASALRRHPLVLVEGDNKPGLGCQIAKSIGDAGINRAS
jgi:hypothetical protein